MYFVGSSKSQDTICNKCSKLIKLFSTTLLPELSYYLKMIKYILVLVYFLSSANAVRCKPCDVLLDGRSKTCHDVGGKSSYFCWSEICFRNQLVVIQDFLQGTSVIFVNRKIVRHAMFVQKEKMKNVEVHGVFLVTVLKDLGAYVNLVSKEYDLYKKSLLIKIFRH